MLVLHSISNALRSFSMLLLSDGFCHCLPCFQYLNDGTFTFVDRQSCLNYFLTHTGSMDDLGITLTTNHFLSIYMGHGWYLLCDFPKLIAFWYLLCDLQNSRKLNSSHIHVTPTYHIEPMWPHPKKHFSRNCKSNSCYLARIYYVTDK